jgi:hypothetical protein
MPCFIEISNNNNKFHIIFFIINKNLKHFGIITTANFTLELSLFFILVEYELILSLPISSTVNYNTVTSFLQFFYGIIVYRKLKSANDTKRILQAENGLINGII